MDTTYANKLRDLVSNPGSFSGTPGFKFALDTGLDAVNRSNSRMRGSGNALAALTQYGTGLAQQDYGAEVDRMGRLTGQEQQFQLGTDANTNNATRTANDFALGSQANANTAQNNRWNYDLGGQANANTVQRNAWDYSLGQGRNANDATGNAMQYGVNMTRANNDFTLGNRGADNNALASWLNYDTNQGRNGIDYYNAQTNRGTAQSNDFYRGQQNQRDWYSVYPRQRIGGV